MVTVCRDTIFIFDQATQGPLNLAIPPWIGKMSTGDGCSHYQRRNSDFYVAVGPVTRTAGILAQSVKGAGCE